MKKKIVLITGSARKNSNSGIMAESFAERAAECGFQIVRYNAAQMKIGICHACDGCFKAGKACAFEDDFNSIADDLLTADGIVIACPVYWYTFPTSIKAILDKMYSICVAGKSLKGKKVALISCCEERAASTFDGINFSFDKSFSLLEADIVGKVEIAGVNAAGAIENTDGKARAANLVKAFM